MEHGQITLRRERAAQLLGGGIRFFLAAALTASQTVGGYAPFALGLVAAAGPGFGGGAALAGTGVGALLFMDFAQALPHLGIAVLILTAVTAFRGSKTLAQPKALALTAGVLSLAVGGIYVIQSLAPLEKLTPCLAAAVLTSVSAWFFCPVLDADTEVSMADGALFLAATLLLALSDMNILGLSIGRTLLCVLLAYTAYERGSMVGVSAGLGLGLTTDLCTGSGSGIFTAGLG